MSNATTHADADQTFEFDVELDDDPTLGDVYSFECSRAELFGGRVRVGDDIDPSSIIEHATRYTSIAVESAAGGRVVDIWRTPELAVIHDATAEGAAPGVVLRQERLEFEVAAFMLAAMGELASRPVGSGVGDDDLDGMVLMIGSGSPGDEGPKSAVANTPQATYAGIAAAGTTDIDVRPVSAITAWAMIVEALRSEAIPPG